MSKSLFQIKIQQVSEFFGWSMHLNNTYLITNKKPLLFQSLAVYCTQRLEEKEGDEIILRLFSCPFSYTAQYALAIAVQSDGCGLMGFSLTFMGVIRWGLKGVVLERPEMGCSGYVRQQASTCPNTRAAGYPQWHMGSSGHSPLCGPLHTWSRLHLWSRNLLGLLQRQFGAALGQPPCGRVPYASLGAAQRAHLNPPLVY